jgi:hypothetical protein
MFEVVHGFRAQGLNGEMDAYQAGDQYGNRAGDQEGEVDAGGESPEV